ncbi:hypothetical protein [Endozoicomonas atrinae]|uniref:hypothetical protein n=1 Tax=Endozoicomonas atrinae TaxID=1333660 RepID=UPI000825B353|nr:hypothetical protein [Endozoicomonas atrinae]
MPLFILAHFDTPTMNLEAKPQYSQPPHSLNTQLTLNPVLKLIYKEGQAKTYPPPTIEHKGLSQYSRITGIHPETLLRTKEKTPLADINKLCTRAQGPRTNYTN